MCFKILELYPPTNRSPRVLEIGCGEGASAIFLARNGYSVKAFDLSDVGVKKTLERADQAQVQIEAFRADINEFTPEENFDIVFSSGTLQYLLPEKRSEFIESCKEKTTDQGLHVLHTKVKERSRHLQLKSFS